MLGTEAKLLKYKETPKKTPTWVWGDRGHPGPPRRSWDPPAISNSHTHTHTHTQPMGSWYNLNPLFLQRPEGDRALYSTVSP